MRLHTHLWSSALLSLTIYPGQPGKATLMTLAGVLVDLDHLALYMVRSDDWSIVGALCYNRYRHQRRVPGDTRPRYGPLRSWIHEPVLTLPLLWWLAYRYRALQPVALGVTLHLVLDGIDFRRYRSTRWQASIHPRNRL